MSGGEIQMKVIRKGVSIWGIADEDSIFVLTENGHGSLNLVEIEESSNDGPTPPKLGERIECPKCHKTFANQHGLDVHRSKAHKTNVGGTKKSPSKNVAVATPKPSLEIASPKPN
jgi:hypothetical protein